MRRLNPEEQSLWRKVVESVRPLHERAGADAPAEAPPQAEPKAASKPPGRPPSPPPPPRRKPLGETLDASWDRRLSRGMVQPDRTVDLHGHNLATAYDILDRRLDSAISEGARLLLLITGKPPGPERPIKRGAIRAAVGDWLAASRHAADIAAVRTAHPRHGGTGALYIVLRRRR